MAQQLQAATRTAAEALKSGLNSLQHDLNRAGLMRRLHSSVRVVQAQSLNLVGSLQSGSTGLQNQGQAALRRLEAYAAGMTPRWAGAGSRYVPTWLARLQVAMLRWLMVPWVLAVLACLLLPPLLRRSSILRLLVSAAGAVLCIAFPFPDRQLRLSRFHARQWPHISSGAKSQHEILSNL